MHIVTITVDTRKTEMIESNV